MLELLLIVLILAILMIFMWMCVLIKNYPIDSAVYEYFEKVGYTKKVQRERFKEYRLVIKKFNKLYNKHHNYQAVSLKELLLNPIVIKEELTPVNEQNLQEKVNLYSKFSKPTQKRIIECYRKYFILASSIRYYENCLNQANNTLTLLKQNNEKFSTSIPLLVNEKNEYLQLIIKELISIIEGLKSNQIKLEDCINKLGKMDRSASLGSDEASFKVLDQVIYNNEKCQISKKKSLSFTGASIIQSSLLNLNALEMKLKEEKVAKSNLEATVN